MRVYLYYLAGFLNMPSAQVPVLCFYPLRFFFSSSSSSFMFIFVLSGLFDVGWRGSTFGGREEEGGERERERALGVGKLTCLLTAFVEGVESVMYTVIQSI